MYKNKMLPVSLGGYENCCLILKENHRLMILWESAEDDVST
jgi:hypothetical protein